MRTRISKRTSTFPPSAPAKCVMGLAVDLTDNNGKLLEKTKIDFVSPQVDSTLQGILVKAPVQCDAGDAAQRADGEGRSYLEHEADGGGSGAGGDAAGRTELCLRGASSRTDMVMAHRTSVTLGDTVGNNYSIISGSERGRPGDRLGNAVPGGRHAGDADGRPPQPSPRQQTSWP